MKNLKIKTHYVVLIAIFLFSLLLNNCKKETEENAAPTIPPVGALEMDFSDFQSGKKAAMTMQNTLPGTSKSYFNASASCVVIWSAIVALYTAIPVAAYKASFNNKAVYEGNNVWHWSYDVNVNSGTFTATLKATLESDSVHWQMYISKTGLNAFTDFLWFEGRSEYSLSGGWWILNESPQIPDKLLQIDWSRESDNVASLKYTYVKPSDTTNIGNFIYFGKTDQNGIYNAYYHLLSNLKGELAKIEWSTTTKEGRVQDSVFFKDNSWHCWDSNQYNTECP